MSLVTEGTHLWTPTENDSNNSNIEHFRRFIETNSELHLPGYHDLWKWSTSELEVFWSTVWDYFNIIGTRSDHILEYTNVSDAVWFSGSKVNFAENLVRHASEDYPAILFGSEDSESTAISWRQLLSSAAQIQQYLRTVGVGVGDRVVSYLPNRPETISAFIAVAGLGAIWSSCAPEFGSRSVIDRFKQISPKVFFATTGYRYGGELFDRRNQIHEIHESLPTLAGTLIFSTPELTLDNLPNTTSFEDLPQTPPASLAFERVPFDHPLWVVYTSGTTGLPKPIVHGHGGVLLEELKLATFHFDQRKGDRFFWYSSTGWIMWNLVTSVLLTGATIALYDGSPGYPDIWKLWDFAAEVDLTFLGLSAAYIIALMNSNTSPGSRHELSKLRAVGSTGSPLPPSGFDWLYRNVKPDLWVVSASGGTDTATAMLGGVPTLPVRAGELQARCLGCKVESFDPEGTPKIGEVGELVITEPMPSMPLYLWGDNGSRYEESYFSKFPGVWHHGDWIKITEEGSVVVYGRSDSTINRKGVRIGTSEMYSVIEEVEPVADSLVIDVGEDHNSALLICFIVVSDSTIPFTSIEAEIRSVLRNQLSPRHVPDQIIHIPEVPRTLNGKKLEVPIKRILQGDQVADSLNVDSMANPNSIEFFTELAGRLQV